MDNIAHTLIGVGIARAGLSKKWGRGTTWVLAVSSNIPDLDVFWGFVRSDPSFMYRRMLTHSVIGVPLVALLCALVFTKIFKNLSFKTTLGLSLIGALTHVFFDLVNSYGVVVLYPFSRHRYELAVLFIIDLFLWASLLIPILVERLFFRLKDATRLYQISVASVAGYVALCFGLRLHAQSLLNAWIRQENLKPRLSYIFPEPFGPQRFHGVVREESTYRSVLIHTISGRVEERKRVATFDTDPAAVAVRQTPAGRQFEWFFKAPVWRPFGASVNESTEQPSTIWDVYDLRFESEVLNRSNPFVFRFDVSAQRIDFVGADRR